MRGYSTMTDEERKSILSQHKTFYNGYQVQSIPSSYQPLEEKSYANDMGGITVNNKGEVSSYRNYGINENYQLNEYDFEDEEPIVDLNDDMEYSELMSSLEEMLDEAGYEDENEFDYVESEVAEKYKIEERVCSTCGLTEEKCECSYESKIDEEIKESFENQKSKIHEMMKRMKIG
jgi:hypothetical protein